MIDIAQLPTASSTANTAAPAAASGVASPGDGKESGFQSDIGKEVDSIGAPVQQSERGDDLGSRITWMIKQDVTAADIKLNPPHLGPLEVKISMSQDQISVAFTSHHAIVRDALDTALPRLRDMLSDNVLQLANANVSYNSAADQGGSQHYGADDQGNGQRGAARNGDGEDGALAVTAALPGAGRYLVDYYA